MEAINIKTIFGITIILSVLAGTCSCSRELEKEEPFIENGNNQDNTGEGNPYWDWADRYPGVVSSLIERSENVEVPVRGGYAPFSFAPDTAALQSSGLYAAGGEYITIEVPEGTENLHCQIGIGYKLLDGQLRRRYYDVVRQYPLRPGKNEVMSYFGGYLYFYYPAGKVPSDDIAVTVSGAVESDDFILGVTNKMEWLERMQARAALLLNPSEDENEMAFLRWTELRSDKMVITAGIKEMATMQDPELLLKNYGTVVDSYYEFSGFDNTNQMPMRIYTDIQLPDAEQTVSMSTAKVERYGRYPIGYRRGLTDANTAWEEDILNPYYCLGIADPATEKSFLKHLLGFCEATSSNWQKSELLNWPVGKMSQRYLIAREGNIIGSDEVNYEDCVKQLNEDNPRTSDRRFMYVTLNEMQRTVMLMQLAHEYGWGMFPYLSRRCRELNFDYEENDIIHDQAANDFFVMTMSEYSGKNLYPFFKKWSFPCSEMAIRYMRNFEPLNEEFWRTFDVSKSPSFEARTPDKRFESVRPSGRLSFSMQDSDALDNWFLHGALYNVDKSTPNKPVYVRQANNLYNTDWKRAFDGDITKGIQILGHCQNKTNDTYANIPIVYLSFVGPEGLEDISQGGLIRYTGQKPSNTNLNVMKIWIPESTDLESYSEEPLTFNTLELVSSNQYYMTNYFYDIEYWDLEEKQWKPTKPDEFKFLFTHVYETYYFEETYTTTRIRYKMQPIVPGTSGYSICEYNEMNFGLVRED